MQTLPLKDTDLVVVAIGEDTGASIMATALLKELKAKRLVSRPSPTSTKPSLRP